MKLLRASPALDICGMSPSFYVIIVLKDAQDIELYQARLFFVYY